MPASMFVDVSFDLDTGGLSQSLAVTPASIASAPVTGGLALITPTVDCFVRQGAAPVAVATGADQFLLAGFTYRCSLPKGSKLAFIAAGGASGTAYITPGT